jgi:hypothetical protein
MEPVCCDLGTGCDGILVVFMGARGGFEGLMHEGVALHVTS